MKTSCRYIYCETKECAKWTECEFEDVITILTLLGSNVQKGLYERSLYLACDSLCSIKFGATMDTFSRLWLLTV